MGALRNLIERLGIYSRAPQEVDKFDVEGHIHDDPRTIPGNIYAASGFIQEPQTSEKIKLD